MKSSLEQIKKCVSCCLAVHTEWEIKMLRSVASFKHYQQMTAIVHDDGCWCPCPWQNMEHSCCSSAARLHATRVISSLSNGCQQEQNMRLQFTISSKYSFHHLLVSKASLPITRLTLTSRYLGGCGYFLTDSRGACWWVRFITSACES